MRLWSLHPQYLDTKGLLALWREGLLAQKVLLGKTKAYKNHPQLIRFLDYKDPSLAMGSYLTSVLLEAQDRGYSFDKKKIEFTKKKIQLKVTKSQLEYEFTHLVKKLRKRDEENYKSLKKVKKILPHPLFKVVPGPVEDWEKVKK